jgi:hypothetical protein
MLDLLVAGDESESGRVFCVAGYMAPMDVWERLDGPWAATLADESLTEFKAADCEHVRGEFTGRSLQDCQRIWRRFVGLIHSIKLFAAGTVVDSEAWGEFGEAIRIRGGWNIYEKAYYPSFLWTVTEFVNSVAGAPADETIAFTFDQHKEYEGRAKRLYDTVCRQSANPRLGTLSFANSVTFPSLQAADMLAYEVMKYFKETMFRSSDVRPQWERLVVEGGNATRIRYMDRPRIELLTKAVRDEPVFSHETIGRALSKVLASSFSPSATAPSEPPSPLAQPTELS